MSTLSLREMELLAYQAAAPFWEAWEQIPEENRREANRKSTEQAAFLAAIDAIGNAMPFYRSTDAVYWAGRAATRQPRWEEEE